MYRPFSNPARSTIASSSEQRAVSQAHPFASRNLHPPTASATAKLDGEQEQPRSPAPVKGPGHSLRTLSLLPGDVPPPPSTPHRPLTRDNNSQLVSPKGPWNQQNVTVDQPQHALPFSPALFHEVLPVARTSPVEFGISDDPTRNAESLAAEAASGIEERATLRGKTLVLPGIAHPEAMRSMHSLDQLGATLSSELPFRKFRLRLQGHTLQLEGKINPWIKLATGEISNNPQNKPPVGNGWTWTYNRQKLYAVTSLQGSEGDTLILPVKGLFYPYNPEPPTINPGPQYGGGLPSLPGGSMGAEHATHTDVLQSEIDEESLRKYELVGNPQKFSSNTLAGDPYKNKAGKWITPHTDYRVYTAEVKQRDVPGEIPDLTGTSETGKYHETHKTFTFQISTSGLTKANTDEEIRDAVEQAAKDQHAIPDAPSDAMKAHFPNLPAALNKEQQAKARNEFKGAIPTLGLIQYIRERLPAAAPAPLKQAPANPPPAQPAVPVPQVPAPANPPPVQPVAVPVPQAKQVAKLNWAQKLVPPNVAAVPPVKVQAKPPAKQPPANAWKKKPNK